MRIVFPVSKTVRRYDHVTADELETLLMECSLNSKGIGLGIS
jgi:hypothetical protein